MKQKTLFLAAFICVFAVPVTISEATFGVTVGGTALLGAGLLAAKLFGAAIGFGLASRRVRIMFLLGT